MRSSRLWYGGAGFRLSALVLIAALASACGEVPEDVSQPMPTQMSVETAQQAVVQAGTLQLGGPTQTVDEGEPSTVNINSLCVTVEADAWVKVDWDFDVPDTVTDTYFFSGAPGEMLFEGPNCGGPGSNLWQVCPYTGAGVNPCLNQPHTYPDGESPRVYQVVGFASQSSAVGPWEDDTTLSPITRSVNNLAPTVDPITSPGGGESDEGDSVSFSADVSDPGTLSDEIVTVTWEWLTNPGGLPAGPFMEGGAYQVTCTCGALPDECVDNDGTPVADDNLCGQTAMNRSWRFLQDGDYDLTVTVTDDVGASDSEVFTQTVSNVDPTFDAATIQGNQFVGPTALSTDLGNPTLITEGLNYTFATTGVFDHGFDTVLAQWIWGDTTTYPLGGPGNEGTIPFIEPYDGSGLAIDTGSWIPVDILSPVAGNTYDDVIGPNDYTLRFQLDDQDSGTAFTDYYLRVVDIVPNLTQDMTLITSNTVDEDPTALTQFEFKVESIAPAADPLNAVRWMIQVGVGPAQEMTDTVLNVGDDLVVSDGSDTITIQRDAGCAAVPPADGTIATQCSIKFVDSDHAGAAPLVSIWAGIDDLDNEITVTTSAINVTVSNVNPAIAMPGGIGVSPTDPDEVDDQVDLSFAFTDPAGTYDANYAVSIDWGDTVGTDSSVETNSGGALVFSYNYPDDTGAPFTPTVNVCEAGGANCVGVTPADDDVAVVNQAPTASITAGSPPSGELLEGLEYDLAGSWDDVAGADDDDYHWDWSWNDHATGSPIGDTGRSGSDSYANRTTAIDHMDEVLFTDVDESGRTGVSISLAVTDEDDAGDTSTPAEIFRDVRDAVPSVSIIDVHWIDDDQDELAIPILELEVGPETPADLLEAIRVDWDGDGTFDETFTHGLDDVWDGPFPNLIDLNADVLPLNDFGGTTNPATTIFLTKGTGPDSDLFTATPEEYDDSGDFDIEVRVYDEEYDSGDEDVGYGAGATTPAEDTMTATVDNVVPEVLGSLPLDGDTVIVSEGEGASFVVRGDDVAPADILDLQFWFDWGEVADPSDTSDQELVDGEPDDEDVEDVSESTGRVTHFYQTPGLYTVTICAQDHDHDPPLSPSADADVDGRSSLLELPENGGCHRVDVEVNNLAPVINDTFNTGPIFEGDQVTSVVMVENLGAETLTYTWRTDCPAGPIDAATFGTGTIVSTPGSVLSGVTYTDSIPANAPRICVEVCDDDGLPNSCVYGETTVTVLNQAPVVTAYAGAPLGLLESISGNDAVFTYSSLDAGLELQTYTHDCGGGTLSAVTDGVGFTCTYNASGFYNVILTVTDAEGASVQQSLPVTVTNVAPVSVTLADDDPAEGTAATLTASAADVAGDGPLSYRFDIDNDSLFDVITSSSAITHDFGASGAYTASVVVCDIEGACSAAVTTTVNVSNTGPVLSTVTASGNVNEGEDVTITAMASDPGGDSLTYDYSFFLGGLPVGSFLGETSNMLSTSFAVAGTYTVQVTASDGTAPSAMLSDTFDVINVVPVISSLTAAPSVLNESIAGSNVVYSYAVQDTGDVTTYTPDCGGGTPVSDVPGASFTCSYTDSGSYTASLTVEDDDTATDLATFDVTVQNVAPASVALIDDDPAEGVAATLTASATDLASDGPLNYRFDLDNDGAFDISTTDTSVMHDYGASGSYTASVVVCDIEGACSTAVTTTVNIANTGPVLSTVTASGNVNEGEDVTITAMASDPGGDSLTYDYAFFLGGVPAGSFLGETSNMLSTSFAVAGTYTVQVTASDGTAPSAMLSDTFDVINVVPVISSLTAAPSVLNESIAGSNVVYSYAVQDTGDVSTYTPDCGGGTPVSDVPGASFTCSYTDSGSYTASLTVEDDDTATDSATFDVTVQNVAPASVALIDDDPAEGVAATLTASATDLASDGPLNYRFDLDNDGVFDISTTDTSVMHNYGASGSYTASVVVCDVEGACSAAVTTSVDVSNAAPVITSVTPSGDVDENENMTVTVVASDPGGDTLTYDYVFRNSGGTAVVTAAGETSNMYTASFGDADTYTVEVTVTDDDAPALSFGPVVSAGFVVANVGPAITALTATPSIIDEAVGGTDVVFNYTATDSGGDISTYTHVCGDGNAPTVEVDGTSFTCNYTDSGSYTASLTVEDNDAATASDTFDVTVQNVAPTGVTLTVSPSDEENPATLTATATDLASDAPLSYRFDLDNDGVVDVITDNAAINHMFGASGTGFVSSVVVCDAEGACSASVTDTFDVNNSAPVISSVTPSGDVNEGAPITVTVAASDAGGDALTYDYVFLKGGVPVQTFAGETTNMISTSFTDSGNDYTVEVTVTDEDFDVAGPVAAPFTVFNIDPMITSMTATPSSVDEAAAGNDVVVTYAVADPGNDVATYTPDCGGGTHVVAADVPGTSFTCNFVDSGAYTVNLTVEDADTTTAMRDVTVNVNNLPPSGVTLSLAVGNVPDEVTPAEFEVVATDLASDNPLTYRYDVNDDGIVDVISDSNTLSYDYDTSENIDASVIVCDAEDACSAPAALNFDVANVPPTVFEVSLPSLVAANSGVTVNVLAADPGDDLLEYEFIFENSGGATITTVPYQFNNTVTETFAVSDTYTVIINVRDEDGAVHTGAPFVDTFIVSDVSNPVTGSADPAQLLEGDTTLLTAVPTGGTAPYDVSFDVDGDGTFDDFAMGCDPGDPANACEINWTYDDNLDENVPYRVFVSTTDQGGIVATGFLTVAVDNDAPVFVDPDPGAPTPVLLPTGLIQVNETDPASPTAWTADLQVDDAGILDTVSYELIEGPDGMTVTGTDLDWVAAEWGLISWDPTWEFIGVHDVTVRATDKDGDFADHSFQIEVLLVDTDNGNGVSDFRELDEFGGPITEQPTDDTDNDGVNDLQEVLDGTAVNGFDGPSAPIVIFPEDEAVDTLTPILKVANATSPRALEMTYTFVILDPADPAGPFLHEETNVVAGASITEFEVPVTLVLDEDTEYTWYAYANDGLVDGPQSEQVSFLVSVTNDAPPASDPLTPNDGAIFVLGATPLLEGVAVADADGDDVEYWFEISDDSFFVNIILTSDPRPIPYYGLGEVLLEGTYYWRVVTSDGINGDVVGTGASFEIQRELLNTAPSMPLIVSPDDESVDSTDVTMTIDFSLDPEDDPLTYEFEIADNLAFIGAATSGEQAGLTFEVTGLSEDMEYYWRARAFDGVLYSDWSLGSFMVNATNSAPDGLAIVTPADGSLIDGIPTSFVVGNALDADGDSLSYSFELAADAEFSDMIATGAVEEGEGTTEWTPAEELDLNVGDAYFWRITVSDGTDTMTQDAEFTIYKELSDDGCGCAVTGARSSNSAGWLLFALIGLVVAWRRRR